MAKTAEKADPCKVSKAAALKMFHDLGFKATDKWTDAKLAEKIGKLDEMSVDPDQVEDEDSAKLLKKILTALEDGAEIKMGSGEAKAPAKTESKPAKKSSKKDEDDEEETEEADEDDEEETEEEEEKPKKVTKKPEKVSKKKSDDDDDDTEEDEEKPKKVGKGKPVASNAGGGKRPGIIQTIINRLKKASEKKPVAKDDILEELKEAFPDRDERAMKSTINSQVPSGLKAEKAIIVMRNDNGYWIEDSNGY